MSDDPLTAVLELHGPDNWQGIPGVIVCAEDGQPYPCATVAVISAALTDSPDA